MNRKAKGKKKPLCIGERQGGFKKKKDSYLRRFKRTIKF
jgi:hypothetical protein